MGVLPGRRTRSGAAYCSDSDFGGEILKAIEVIGFVLLSIAIVIVLGMCVALIVLMFFGGE